MTIANQQPIESSLVNYYARRAAEYERIYHKPERQEDLEQLRGLLECFFAAKNVFEVACGTGFWTEVISHSAASILATDINEEVLAVARAKPFAACQHIEFRRENVYALHPLPQEFSAGLAAFWWSHVSKAKLRDFLKCFHQVFSHGSNILMMDNLYIEGSSTPVSRIDNDGNTYQIRKLDDGSTHEVLKNFPTEQELRSALDGFGTNIEIKFLKHFWVLTYTPITS